ncbi:XPG I-region [Aspergillus sp. HF37]|nr:XPG I-region [Aspergillus sp. HF37]
MGILEQKPAETLRSIVYNQASSYGGTQLIQYRLISAIGTGERISLSKLAISHLERTSRPIRIAVDISIWLFQVQAGKGGTNPELRTLFYRLLKFLALPVHPLFVYDGKEKPPFKRGKAVSGHSYGNAPIIRLSQTLIDLFKFPRHNAPGEAEAECARLQRTGVVDAVMSNDVDALMFGSSLGVMNFSKESGSGTAAATHVTRYQMQDPVGPSNVGLDRAGMILFAMLSGGDYLPSGVPKCGSKLAAEIAKAGFGQDLLEALGSDGAELDTRLSEWRDRLQYELEENESGYFQTKHKAVRIPETFPDRTILSYYAKPIVSTAGDIDTLKKRLLGAWDKEVDALEIRRFAAQTFDWNYRSGARKVVRLLAEPLISHRLRLGRDPSAFPSGVSLASNNGASMVQRVYRSRTSFSTDGLSELQLDMVPIDVVGLNLLAEEPNPPPPPTPLPSQETVELGEEDDDPEPAAEPAEPVPQSPTKKRVTKRYDPYVAEKVWVFETIAEIGIPDVVRKWKKELADKASAVKKTSNRKAGPKKKGPIDPGMKHGSLLKYGTLTKERSEVSHSKQAPLFGPPVSTPPRSSSSMFHSFQEPPSSMRNFSGRHMNVQHMPIVERQAPILDDLDDLFTSFSGISPSRSVKRHAMANRCRVGTTGVALSSGDTSVETLETSIREISLDHPSPPTSRKITMSYSNASFDQGLDTKPIAISPSAESRNRRISKEQSYDFEDPPEVQELEDSMKSLSLMYPEVFGECTKACTRDSQSAAPIARSSSKKETKEPKFQLRSPSRFATEPPLLDEETQHPAPADEETPASASKLERESRRPGEQAEECSSKKEKPDKPGAAQQDPKGNTHPPDTANSRNNDSAVKTDPSHDTMDAAVELSRPPSPQAEEEDKTPESTPKRRNTKKKRAARVSVVDLT